MTAQEYFDLGVELRKQARFGDAINAFNKAVDLSTNDQELAHLRASALCSIEHILEIQRFYNADLMNP